MSRGFRHWDRDESHPGIAATMFETLADESINIDMISTSPIRTSCIVRTEDVERAVTLPQRRLRPRLMSGTLSIRSSATRRPRPTRPRAAPISTAARRAGRRDAGYSANRSPTSRTGSPAARSPPPGRPDLPGRRARRRPPRRASAHVADPPSASSSQTSMGPNPKRSSPTSPPSTTTSSQSWWSATTRPHTPWPTPHLVIGQEGP